MSGLPKGWKELSIGEVTLPFKSIDPTKEPSKEYRYIDIGSIDNSRQIITDPKAFKGRDAPSRARRVVQECDVLFSTVRTYLKNIATVPRELSGALTSTGIAVLRSSALMDSSYLFHWVTSDAFVTEISKAQDGTMYPAVSDRDVLSSRIAVPPLTEQRRIVAKLDSLTGGTTRAREQLGRIPRLISKYREAILSKAFEGVFVGLSSAGQVTLSAYVKSLDQGWSPKCESSASDDPKDWAVIKTTAIQPIHFFACENKKLPPTLQPRPNIQIQAGDVLITRAGPRSRVGISCVVTTARPHLMLCDKAYRIRAKDGKADPTFLAMMLNSPQALRQIEEMKTGISDSGLNLTQEKFLNLSLPKLNLEQQQTTVRRIETAFAWLDRVAAEHANASRLLPKLDQAILAKAFRGELISQNSTEGGNLVPPPKLEGNPHRQSGANRQRT